MCGVVGLLLRDPMLEPSLGSMLFPMIEALSERGPDSSGIALYADPRPGHGDPSTVTGLRISLGSDTEVDWTTLEADLPHRGAAQLERFGAGVVVELPEERG